MKQTKLFKELKIISIIYLVLYAFIFIANIVMYNKIIPYYLIPLAMFLILLLVLLKKMPIAPKVSIAIASIALIYSIFVFDIIGIIISIALLSDSISLLKAIKYNE